MHYMKVCLHVSLPEAWQWDTFCGRGSFSSRCSASGVLRLNSFCPSTLTCGGWCFWEVWKAGLCAGVLSMLLTSRRQDGDLKVSIWWKVKCHIAGCEVLLLNICSSWVSSPSLCGTYMWTCWCASIWAGTPITAAHQGRWWSICNLWPLIIALHVANCHSH